MSQDQSQNQNQSQQMQYHDQHHQHPGLQSTYHPSFNVPMAMPLTPQQYMPFGSPAGFVLTLGASVKQTSVKQTVEPEADKGIDCNSTDGMDVDTVVFNSVYKGAVRYSPNQWKRQPQESAIEGAEDSATSVKTDESALGKITPVTTIASTSTSQSMPTTTLVTTTTASSLIVSEGSCRVSQLCSPKL